LVDLSECVSLESLRILKNPISDKHTSRHVRNISVGEIRSLRIVNGTELKRYDRRDFEYYYLNWVFKEYFRLMNTCHEEYLEEEFMQWAAKTHPNAVKYVTEYDNPYPQLKGKVLTEADGNIAGLTKPIVKNQYLNLFFTPYFGPCFGKKMPKKFPANTDILYIRAWCGQYFKIKDMSAVDLKFRLRADECWEKIDENEMTKGLDHFGILSGCEFIIDPKEGVEEQNGNNTEEVKENTPVESKMVVE